MNCRKKEFGLIFMLWLVFSPLHAATPEETFIPVHHIYAPKGFDSNDNTEIILSGSLPNLCHQSPHTKVKVEGFDIKISVMAFGRHGANTSCPAVKLPFLLPVSTGPLKEGTYQILVNQETRYEKREQIVVEPSPVETMDNHIYANIQGVEVPQGNHLAGKTIQLSGHNPSDCMVYNRTEVIFNGKDTYSVMPIMKQISDFCPMKMVPLKIPFQVPSNLGFHPTLLHIRSMDGKSVNYLLQNPN